MGWARCVRAVDRAARAGGSTGDVGALGGDRRYGAVVDVVVLASSSMWSCRSSMSCSIYHHHHPTHLCCRLCWRKPAMPSGEGRMHFPTYPVCNDGGVHSVQALLPAQEERRKDMRAISFWHGMHRRDRHLFVTSYIILINHTTPAIFSAAAPRARRRRPDSNALSIFLFCSYTSSTSFASCCAIFCCLLLYIVTLVEYSDQVFFYFDIFCTSFWYIIFYISFLYTTSYRASLYMMK